MENLYELNALFAVFSGIEECKKWNAMKNNRHHNNR